MSVSAAVCLSVCLCFQPAGRPSGVRLSVSPSFLRPPARLPVCLSVHLSIRPPIRSSSARILPSCVRRSMRLAIHTSPIRVSMHPCVRARAHLSVRPSFHPCASSLSVCRSIHLSVYPSVRLCVRPFVLMCMCIYICTSFRPFVGQSVPACMLACMR